jgi:hypothetical protein
MYIGVFVSATVRKNFVFDQEVAMHLEELAKESRQSMTSLIQEMIEDRYKSIKVKKRLEAFEKFSGSANGLFKEKSIQSIKADMDV